MGFFITEPNSGDFLIQLKKDRTKTTDEVSDEIRTQIESSLPQLRVDFGQVIGDMLGDLMSSVQPIEIKLFGNNRDSIENISAANCGNSNRDSMALQMYSMELPLRVLIFWFSPMFLHLHNWELILLIFNFNCKHK